MALGRVLLSDGEVGEPARGEAAAQVVFAHELGGVGRVERCGLVVGDGVFGSLDADDGLPGGHAPHRTHGAELADGEVCRVGTTALTARRRLDLLIRGEVARLATELDLSRLGVNAEALLWITVQPGALEQTAHALTEHRRVRFAAARPAARI